jgi:hypothetical protein
MRERVVLFGLLLLILLLGCHDAKQPRTGTAQEPVSAQSEFFGHLGEGSSTSGEQKWEYQVPIWQKGPQGLLLGVAGWPGRAVAPVFFAIARFPAGTGSGQSARHGINLESERGTKIFMSVTLSRGTVDAPSVVFRLDEGSHKEKVEIGGKDYTLKGGRVFLLDQTTSPHSIRQLDADLNKLFPSGGKNASKNDFAQAVKELRSQWPEDAVLNSLGDLEVGH